jgi:hypothetical protein
MRWARSRVASGSPPWSARSGSFGPATVAVRFVAAALFLVFAFVVGQRLVDSALRAVMRRGAGVSGAFIGSRIAGLHPRSKLSRWAPP